MLRPAGRGEAKEEGIEVAAEPREGGTLLAEADLAPLPPHRPQVPTSFVHEFSQRFVS